MYKKSGEIFQAEPSQLRLNFACSVSVNGVLLTEGIPTTNRFGGLLQLIGRRLASPSWRFPCPQAGWAWWWPAG
jgi:hypothetical protein